MFFEEFEVNKMTTSRSRVVTGTDIDLFCALTGAVNPLFLSDETARKAGQPARMTPGPLLFSFTIGLCYQAGVFDHVIAMAGVNNMRFHSPVHPGDMLTASAMPLETKPTKKADRGVVVLKHELKNQHGALVLDAEVTYLMRTRKQD